MFYCLATPLEPWDSMAKPWHISLFSKRDDLFPFVGGGNKARKIKYIIADAKKQGANALITTGGIQSNHARVVAIAAAELGWPCYLVLHGCKDDPRQINGNYALMKMAGGQISIVSPEDIADTIETISKQCKGQGLFPYVIPGGGHTLQGSCAYFDAMLELAKQSEESGWIPDWIVLASGTGTTQAGIIGGVQHLGWQTKVVGVSVARERKRGRNSIIQSYRELCEEKRIDFDEGKVDFRDTWIDGGYEQAGERILEIIKWACKNHGIFLDPTYTGKAFLGMIDMIRSREITAKSQVLFWHTGGLLNLLSSGIFLERLTE